MFLRECLAKKALREHFRDQAASLEEGGRVTFLEIGTFQDQASSLQVGGRQ